MSEEDNVKVPVYLGNTVTYSQSELEAMALNYLKRNDKKTYQSMNRAEIAEYCKLKADAATREAKNLITCGVWDQEAWNRAIRSQVLGSDSD